MSDNTKNLKENQKEHIDPQPEHGKDDKGHHPKRGNITSPGSSHPSVICYKMPFNK